MSIEEINQDEKLETQEGAMSYSVLLGESSASVRL